MKNIAFVITKSEIGGAQSWVNEVANTLSSQVDCQKIILITSEHGWLTECLIFDEVKIIPGILKRFSILSVIQLVSCLKKNKIDVVISSSANAGLYSRVTKLFYKHTSIYVSHGWSCIYNGGRLKNLFCRIENILAKITDVILCVSESDKKKAIEVLNISPDKIRVILNAITPMPPRVRKYNEIERKILFVGRLTYPKRPDLIADFVADNPEYSLHVVGDGEYLPELKSKYSSYSNIEFLGEVKSFKKFAEYDLFVLTSDSEGLPVSAIEAHTAGIPLVLSNVGGCSELINGNGILVENTYDSLSKAIRNLFDNYDEYYHRANCQRMNFSIDKRKEDYFELILR